MLRYEDLKDISDGRIYTENDMVRADTMGCKGCSKCCESDMGKSIVLDPYDMYHLIRATGKTFDELLVAFLIEMNLIDGIVLPNIKMDKGCGFLDENKRCSIHKDRPSICRLFPLGRIYNETGFDYILQTNECPEARSKIKVKKWIDIEDYDEHSAFIKKWHSFLGYARKKVMEQEEPEKAKEIMKVVIREFYMTGYDTKKDFYSQFKDKMREALSDIRYHDKGF